MALEQRDIDRQARVVYVRRALRNGRLKSTETEGSIRAVPLQAIALAALDQLGADRESQLLFPSRPGGYFDLHNFRNRYWTPAQIAAGIVPPRRVYDLRHTFATFALRAGISTFDLSRYMGASLAMIDRHYGHLARADASTQSGSSTATRTSKPPTSKPWTSEGRRNCHRRRSRQRKQRLSRRKSKAL
jgi:integrase